jgi:hypothetical protein
MLWVAGGITYGGLQDVLEDSTQEHRLSGETLTIELESSSIAGVRHRLHTTSLSFGLYDLLTADG